MRASVLFTFLFVVVAVPTRSQSAPAEFPYEAVVEQDGIMVRSGPGERYDPTLKLNTGQQVTVHRHDPGGWYMISPPSGSFSWIDAAYVEKSGAQTGVVKVPSRGDGLPPRVVVWIGSQFTDDHKYFGRQLASGDEVQILGEATHNGDAGPAQFYKIAPPRLEYRWVKGDFIVPLAEAGRIARSAPISTPVVSAEPVKLDPFANPNFAEQQTLPPGFPPEQGPALLDRELTRGIAMSAPDVRDTPVAETAADRTQLSDLDGKLKTMLAQTPDRWDLTGMEQAYRQLQSTAGRSVAVQIESRLAAIESRKSIKSEFDSFVSLTKQTEDRDAALLSMQQSLATGMPINPEDVDLGQPTGFPQQVHAGNAPQNAPTNLAPGTPTTPTPVPDSQPPVDAAALDGAGVIQRLPYSQPGMPTHALVAPDGRHLAYLAAAQGVRLDTYAGKSMGVVGKRSHDNRLRSDVIIVERLTPVQLQP